MSIDPRRVTIDSVLKEHDQNVEKRIQRYKEEDDAVKAERESAVRHLSLMHEEADKVLKAARDEEDLQTRTRRELAVRQLAINHEIEDQERATQRSIEVQGDRKALEQTLLGLSRSVLTKIEDSLPITPIQRENSGNTKIGDPLPVTPIRQEDSGNTTVSEDRPQWRQAGPGQPFRPLNTFGGYRELNGLKVTAADKSRSAESSQQLLSPFETLRIKNMIENKSLIESLSPQKASPSPSPRRPRLDAIKAAPKRRISLARQAKADAFKAQLEQTSRNSSPEVPHAVQREARKKEKAATQEEDVAGKEVVEHEKAKTHEHAAAPGRPELQPLKLPANHRYPFTYRQSSESDGIVFPKGARRQSHRRRVAQKHEETAFLKLADNGTIFIAPECMENAPVTKIAEGGPYWEESWITYQALEATLKEQIECLPRTDARRAWAETKLKKFRELQSFFDSYEFHPNQLLAKNYVTGTGLIVYDILLILKNSLETLQRAKNASIIEDEPLNWLRGRLAKLKSEENPEGSFALKGSLRNVHTDPQMIKIKQELETKQFVASGEVVKYINKAPALGSAFQRRIENGATKSSKTTSNGTQGTKRTFQDIHSQGSLSTLTARVPPKKRSHDIPQRDAVTHFCTGLPDTDTTGLRPFYQMKMFPDTFLKHALNVDYDAIGWVVPYVDTASQKQLARTSGPVWMLNVSSNLHLPHEPGAHGLMVQNEEPLVTDLIVPLFLGEQSTNTPPSTLWWYAGQYAVENGELFEPKTKSLKESMMAWATKRAAKLNSSRETVLKKLKKTLNVKAGVITTSDVYQAMLAKDDKPPKMPFYVRRLIFKAFDENFYQKLVTAHNDQA